MPSELHTCGICEKPTRTLHDRACVDCQKRIEDQMKRNGQLAGLFVLEINSLFNTYQEEKS